MRWTFVLLLAGCEPAKSMLDNSPGDTPVGGLDCATVADRVRDSYTEAQRHALTANPKLARWFEITQRVIRESCEQDHWPDAVRQCAVNAKPGQLAACNQVMAPGLQAKMQDRMTAARNELQ